MATHASALKAHRQSLKRRLRNRTHKTRMRSQIKKLRQIVAAGDEVAARGALQATTSLLDRSVKHGVLHRNAAARAKSRLSRAVNRLAAGKA